MGGNSSKMSQALNMDVVNRAIFNQLTINSQKVSTTNTNIQVLRLNIEQLIECPITTGQVIDANTVSSTEFMPEQVSNMKNEIANDLKAAADAQLEKITGAFSTALGNKQDIKQEVNVQLENVVENTLTTENINQLITSTVNVQNEELNVKVCYKSPINMTQDITSALVASAVTRALTTAISSNEYINKVATEAEALMKVEDRGPFESLGEMFKGMWLPIAISAVVSCVLLIVIMMVALSPAGQNKIASMPSPPAYR